MPCYDPRPADEAEVTKWRLDKMTARCCRLARLLIEHNIELPSEDLLWARDHFEFDARDGR